MTLYKTQLKLIYTVFILVIAIKLFQPSVVFLNRELNVHEQKFGTGAPRDTRRLDQPQIPSKQPEQNHC